MATPRVAPRIANRDAAPLVRERKEFRGSTTFARWVAPDRYVVYSYGDHWPMFICDRGQWFFNTSHFSRTTAKHTTQLRPPCHNPIYRPEDRMRVIAAKGAVLVATENLIGVAA